MSRDESSTFGGLASSVMVSKCGVTLDNTVSTCCSLTCVGVEELLAAVGDAHAMTAAKTAIPPSHSLCNKFLVRSRRLELWGSVSMYILYCSLVKPYSTPERALLYIAYAYYKIKL
jgi:hypothetical protein